MKELNKENPQNKAGVYVGPAMAAGIAIGAGIGSATGDIAFWTAMGPAFGSSIWGFMICFDNLRRENKHD